eukprot:8308991-Alexandrium_andersonii.AAC.1
MCIRDSGNTFQGIPLEDRRQKDGSGFALALGQGNDLAGAQCIHGLKGDLAGGNALEDSPQEDPPFPVGGNGAP